MMQNEWWWYGIWVWVAIILFNWNKSKRQIIMWQRKCYWTLIQVCLTDDVIPAPPPNRGDPSPRHCSRSEPRASDNWKGFCWVAAPETIIIRVLPLLDYNREYNIYYLLHTFPAPGSGPAIWFKLWKKDKCSGDYQNYPVQSANAYQGVDSYLSLSCLLVFLIGEDLVIKGSIQMH